MQLRFVEDTIHFFTTLIVFMCSCTIFNKSSQHVGDRAQCIFYLIFCLIKKSQLEKKTHQLTNKQIIAFCQGYFFRRGTYM